MATLSNMPAGWRSWFVAGLLYPKLWVRPLSKSVGFHDAENRQRRSQLRCLPLGKKLGVKITSGNWYRLNGAVRKSDTSSWGMYYVFKGFGRFSEECHNCLSQSVPGMHYRDEIWRSGWPIHPVNILTFQKFVDQVSSK
ncbi:hypothetical protein TNCV_4630261 [Trichonephila clavipes]|nr:hypothetical protein TNCV_4630261 [Trichonephila clavipes]